MAVEVGRGCYAAPMRLWQGSDDTVTVRWYKVADNTPVLPFDSAINSHVYEGDFWTTPRDGIGEVNNTEEPRKANIPHPPGDHFCGLPAWFLHGIPPDAVNAPDCRCVPLFVEAFASFGMDAAAPIRSPVAAATLGWDAAAELPAGLVDAAATLGWDAAGDDTTTFSVQVVVGVWNLDATGDVTPVAWDSANYDFGDWWDAVFPWLLTPPAVDTYPLAISIEYTISGTGTGTLFWQFVDEDDNVLASGSTSIVTGTDIFDDTGSALIPTASRVFVWCSGDFTGDAAISFTIDPP